MGGNINPNRYTFGALRLVPERNRRVGPRSTAIGPRATGIAPDSRPEAGATSPIPTGGTALDVVAGNSVHPLERFVRITPGPFRAPEPRAADDFDSVFRSRRRLTVLR